MRKLYLKNKLIIKLIKPFENKRLFTPLKLSICTLQDYKLWPEKLIVLDAFSQMGLQWTRVFSDEASYIEMWDINPQAIKYAKKEFPRANAICGDTIEAFKQKKFTRTDYNFVLIDSPVPFQYPNGTFEHFDFFTDIFKNIANQCVIIFDVVIDIHKMLAIHPHPKEFTDKWMAARKEFYCSDEGDFVHPDKMIQCYTQRIEQLGYNLKYITYNARNKHFGFITVVVAK
jgi:hypothetical protein